MHTRGIFPNGVHWRMMLTKIEYVVGFLFSEDKRYVTLIQKRRPFWQAGKLNGVGGHVEEYELTNPILAMIREFEEEAGLKIYNWNKAAVLEHEEYVLHVYYAFGDVDKVESKTDECVGVYELESLWSHNHIYNLRWLIPLCLDNETVFPIKINLESKDKK